MTIDLVARVCHARSERGGLGVVATSYRMTCVHCEAPILLSAGPDVAFGVCPVCAGTIPNPTASSEATGSVVAKKAEADWGLRQIDPNAESRFLQIQILCLAMIIAGALVGRLGQVLDSIKVITGGLFVSLLVFGALFVPLAKTYVSRAWLIREWEEHVNPGAVRRALVIVPCILLTVLLAMLPATAFFIIGAVVTIHVLGRQP